jgi:hypothetical protein
MSFHILEHLPWKTASGSQDPVVGDQRSSALISSVNVDNSLPRPGVVSRELTIRGLQITSQASVARLSAFPFICEIKSVLQQFRVIRGHLARNV